MFLKKISKVKLKRVLSKVECLDVWIKIFYIAIFKFIFKYKFKNLKIENDLFVFECFRGKMVNDSPLSIYKYLISQNFKGKYIWVLSSVEHPMYQFLSREEHTEVVIYETKEYFEAYATSKFWIINNRISRIIAKKPLQILVQCWHGTPLKKLGLDIENVNNALTSKSSMKHSYLKESEQINYFISPSPYASKCFISSFGLKKTQIVELGYPRNDTLVNNLLNIDLNRRLKLSLNIPIESTVILYAPTFRDNNFSNEKESHILHNPLEKECFLNNFNDDVVFLYRGHYFTQLSNDSSRFIDVSEYGDINELFLLSDLLITDYSSVFFDYSILNKPTLFFMYDRDEYELETRGFYLDIDNNLPGKISYQLVDLAEDILNILDNNADLSYFNRIFNPYEDGCSTERVVKHILGCNE